MRIYIGEFRNLSTLFLAFHSLLIPALSCVFSFHVFQTELPTRRKKVVTVYSFFHSCANILSSRLVSFYHWQQLPLRHNRLCTRLTCTPLVQLTVCQSAGGRWSPLPRHFLRQLITASGCQRYTGSRENRESDHFWRRKRQNKLKKTKT